jgi:hypothetical protein
LIHSTKQNRSFHIRTPVRLLVELVEVEGVEPSY